MNKRTAALIGIAAVLLLLAGAFCGAAAAAAEEQYPFPDSGILESKTYALSQDVQLKGELFVQDGVEAVIDLYGHTLTAAKGKRAVTVKSGGTLTLKSSRDGSQGVGCVNGNTDTQDKDIKNGGCVYINGGTFNMNAGIIQFNKVSQYGGGVYVQSGTFNMKGGAICLNSAFSAGSGVYVQADGIFNMTGGDIEANWIETDNSTGGGVYNKGTFDMSGGRITGNYATYYAGVYVGGTFTLSGEAVISQNRATRYGGVFVAKNGTFTMSGGSITDNHAEQDGGGVYVAESGRFTMSSGTIGGTDKSINTAGNCGGGVYVDLNGRFTMQDGSIIGNTAQNGGGGVYNKGTFEMSGGSITGNSTTYLSGGGVYNEGKFWMSAGSIEENTATNGHGGGVGHYGGTFTLSGSALITKNKAGFGGGGVHVSDGKLNMSGGSIKENSVTNSYGYGGGVEVWNRGTFTMTGGSIEGNSAPYAGGVHIVRDTVFNMSAGSITGNYVTHQCGVGGGVYAESSQTFNVSGTPVISGNEKRVGDDISPNNVYLPIGALITVSGELKEGADIKIYSPVEENKDFAQGAEYPGYQVTENDARFFHPDDATTSLAAAVTAPGTPEKPEKSKLGWKLPMVAKMDGKKYTSVQAAVDAAGGAVRTITMIADSVEPTVTIGTAQGVTLDLAGHKLQNKGHSGSVIEVSGGWLTLTDSVGGGKVTGGGAENGGGVYVGVGSTFTMEGGSIEGNTATNSGGGVCAAGDTVTMKGGSITSNSANYGGGVAVSSLSSEFSSSKFTMEGSTPVITSNRASLFGGGVYVYGGTFEMKGGSVTGNTAGEAGGGVVLYNDTASAGSSEFIMSGSSSVSGNSADTVKYDNKYNGVVLLKEGGSHSPQFEMSNTASVSDPVYLGDGTHITVPAALTGEGAKNIWLSVDPAKAVLDDVTVVSAATAEVLEACKQCFELSSGYNPGTVFGLFPDQNQTKLIVAKKKYKVTFNSTGGLPESFSQTVYRGELVEKPADPTKSGDIFVKWVTGSGEDYDFDHTPVYSDFTLYAQWKDRAVVRIIFNANGGVFDGKEPSITVPGYAGGKYSTIIPATNRVSKEGYQFAGWYTAEETKINGETDIPDSDTTVYAHWTANTYKVQFDGNGGEGTMADQSFTYDEAEKPLTENSFTKTGYTFDYWLSDELRHYSDKQSVKNLTTKNNDTVTLHAVWKANPYTVRFDANGGTGTMADQPFTYDVEQNLTKNSFTRDGYTFDYWLYNNHHYSDKQSVKNLEPEGIVTLTAQWKANTTYTVHFNGNGSTGGSSMADQEFTLDVAQNLAKNSFTRAGYTFAGWSKTVDGPAEYQDEQSVTNLTTEPYGFVTLYAVWTPHTYTVKFNGNGGEGAMADLPFTYGTAQNLTANSFTKTNYTFEGWSTSAGGVAEYKDKESVKNLTTDDGGEVILYAVWEPKSTNVILDPQGGTGGTTSVTATYNQPMPTITLPAKTGYTFLGYFDSTTGGNQYYNADGTGTKEWDKTETTVTLYAQYAKWTSSGSGSQGSSILLTATPTPTATPAVTPTATQTPGDMPTVKPVTTETPTAKSPMPIMGVLAGLGAAAAAVWMRRK